MGVSYQKPYNAIENARLVYNKMFEMMVRENPSVSFGRFDAEELNAIFSLYINLGSFKAVPSIRSCLERLDLREAAVAALRVHNTRLKGQLYASKGLMARRCKEYNIFMAALEYAERIVRVEVAGTLEKPEFVLLVYGAKEIVVKANYPMHPTNSTAPVNII